MRLALFPDQDADELRAENAAQLAGGTGRHAWIAERRGRRIGYVEAFIRNYAEDCDGPTPYIEEIWVAEDARRGGVGRALIAAVEDWARARGFTEMGSDTWLDHADSQAWHKAIGFEEVERLVVFRKEIAAPR